MPEPVDPFASIAAVLARLDERTERIDRDMRQVMTGQQRHMEAVEHRLDMVEAKATRADERSAEHRKWLTGITTAVILAVVGTLLTQIGLGA